MSKHHTYSLADVAAMVLPPEWKDPEFWLVRRLRRREISGYKVGHTWRMREADVDDLLARYSNHAQPAEPETSAVSITAGLSERGARRLKSAS